MKKILLTAAATIALAALGGCVSPYPGAYSSGAYAGYDGGFDDGYQGYERPVIWGGNMPGAYYGPASYAPPYGYYQQQQPAYGAYGPQTSGWYSTYYCPPQMQMGGGY